jgi:hypothetical protein
MTKDDTVPGAGSTLTGTTGPSAGRRAPGRVMEPAPASHTGPNGDQPDDPWSPPGEPPPPGEPDPWVPNPTGQTAIPFEAEVAGTARTGTPAPVHLSATCAVESHPSASDVPPSRLPALGSTADMWMRFLGQHATTIQAAGGVL